MKTAILIHWTPSKEEFYDAKFPTGSNSHWFPWLSKELIVRDIHTVALEIPFAYEPEYKIWKKELERFDINEDTILVGHSCWAGFLFRWLSEKPNIKVKKVILVAPWIDPFKEIKEKDFFEFSWDANLVKNQDIKIFHSRDDMSSVQESMKQILEKYPNISVKYFDNYGHFCMNDLKSEKFPELLDVILAHESI